MPTRRQTLAALAGASAAALPLRLAAMPSEGEVVAAIRALFLYDQPGFVAALKTLEAYGKPDIASSLIFALRFSPQPHAPLSDLLAKVTGAPRRDDWFDWMLWQEANPQIPSHPGFYQIKRDVLLAIDPNWAPFLKPEFIAADATDIRFEEVAWGGVRRDGIPPLDFPALIDGKDADYLLDDDLVFGVEINGDVRAYPLRIMGWHEMFNEEIGGVPVALAYCTLCGAGILFETKIDRFEDPLIIGTSGFLYRSNKLMYDKTTTSLWNQFTGEPVSGPLRGSGVALKQRPVVIEPWGVWKARNPSTKVLSLQTGYSRDYGSGVVYQDYFSSTELMFPVVAGGALSKKEYIFGIRDFGAQKAWPLTAFGRGRVINDRIGTRDIVLTGAATGRTVRAYDRKGIDFVAGPDAETLIGDGQSWRATEAALIGDDGRKLGRVAGHVAYWFAWNNYLGPQAELFEG
ncbi:MAG: DUF3179 domain-containing protein [Pseudomonadota bacterium]